VVQNTPDMGDIKGVCRERKPVGAFYPEINRSPPAVIAGDRLISG